MNGKYYISGKRPVKEEPTPDGGLKILRMNWDILAFEYGGSPLTEAGGDVEYVTKDEFVQYTEELRARRYRGNDKLSELYRVANWIEDTAKQMGRAMTTEEKSILAMIRCRTYNLFQETYPEP